MTSLRALIRSVLLFALAAMIVPAVASAAPPPAECDHHGVAGSPYEVGVNCRVVEVDGHPRKFVVYLPDRVPEPGQRAPVVFMFHGSTGTGPQFLRISGWRQQADATGLVAVFPQGLRYRVLESGRVSTKWNSFELASEVDLSERPRGYPEGAPWPADDVGFVDSITADLRSQLPIDRRRVYASGFSNGAAFTARLAVERSTEIAAAAFSGGGLEEVQAPARPIPMYTTLGTVDSRALAQTGPPPLAELPLSPFAALAEPLIGSILATHVNTLGLDPGDFGVRSRPDSTSFRWPATGAGPGGAIYRFALLRGVPHKYPNAHNNPAGFEAASEFWEFFRQHPLP